MYSITTGAKNSTQLLRIDKNGGVTPFKVLLPPPPDPTNFPSDDAASRAANAALCKGGTIDIYGIFFLTSNADDNGLYYIDLNNPNADGAFQIRRIPLTITNGLTNGKDLVNLPDIVYDPIDGDFYGVEAYDNLANADKNKSLGKIDKIVLDRDPTVSPGTIAGATVVRLGTYTKNSPNYGGMYVILDDKFTPFLIGWSNAEHGNGDFHKFDITSGNMVDSDLANPYSKAGDSNGSLAKALSAVIPASSWALIGTADGVSCPSLISDIQVTKDDDLLALERNNPTTYTVTVSNLGPAPAKGIQVLDPLPDGVPATDEASGNPAMTWNVVAINGEGTTSSTGSAGVPSVLQSGPLSDVISLSVGGSVVYKVTVIVPKLYPSFKFINTASVKLNNLINDPYLLNNSDYDADKIQPSVLPVNPQVRVRIHKIIR
jgi:uncharacterized repeat protein (TIGR01451 family)